MTEEEAVQAVIEACGTAAELARRLNIKPQAISQWKRVPAEQVLKVEAICGRAVTRYQMRPDVFGSSPPAEDLGARPCDTEAPQDSAA